MLIPHLTPSSHTSHPHSAPHLTHSSHVHPHTSHPHTPHSLLKVILLQSLEASTGTIESKPMDFISLSGVCLRNDHGVWRIQEGCNYHDPLAFDCEDHTETFPLPGGIRAIYNHTHKRWHVLPTSSLTPSMEESRSEQDGSELTEEQDRRSGHVFVQPIRSIFGVTHDSVITFCTYTRTYIPCTPHTTSHYTPHTTSHYTPRTTSHHTYPCMHITLHITHHTHHTHHTHSI